MKILLGTSIATVFVATQTSIIGANRYDTAAKIADNMGNYDIAILVNSDKSLADGLSASSLAGKENAPILLVKKDSIPKETLSRLQKVKKAYIIGGTAAVSSNVTNQLAYKKITRMEGETSENVAKLVENYDEAFIVNGTSSNQNKKSGVKYFVVSGEAVVSKSLVNKFGAVRLSCSDRYKTNRAVVQKFYPNPGKLYYTKGNPLVDALTVSSLAKNDGVVLVSPKSDNSILKDKEVVQVGGMNFNVSFDKPVKPDDNKPNPDEQKPSGKNTALVLTSRNKIDVIDNGAKIDFSRYGVKALDAEDGDITNKIVFTNLPDTSVEGDYKFFAKVTDKGGLTSTLELKVRVRGAVADYDVNSASYQRRLNVEFDRLLQNHRAGRNLISLESRTSELARLKANHMADLGYCGHTYDDSQTKLYTDRWRKGDTMGYKLWVWDIYPDVQGDGKGSICPLGENVYMSSGYRLKPEDLANHIFTSWVDSPMHNDALLSEQVDYYGFHVTKASNGKIYAAYDISELVT